MSRVEILHILLNYFLKSSTIDEIEAKPPSN